MTGISLATGQRDERIMKIQNTVSLLDQSQDWLVHSFGVL